MKRFLIVIASFLFSVSAFAQLKPQSQDWFFYDITHDMLLDAPAGLKSEWYSNGHSFNFMHDIVFGRSNFGVAIGLGFTSNNYHTNLLASISDSGTGVFSVDTSSSFKTNKLTTQYIDIPFELRFRSKVNKKGKFFRLYLGAKIGVRINAYSKFENDNLNVRYYHFDELNRFRYGLYTRIGYGAFSLNAYYGLSELFRKGNTIDGQSMSTIRPLSIGISIGL